MGKNWKAVGDDKVYIVLRWASFCPENFALISKLDRYNLGVKNKDIIKFLMANLMCRRMPKFLKSTKQDKELLDYARRYYNFSSRELDMQKHLIDFKDKVFLSELAFKFGWDKKTCKKYNVDFVTPKKRKIKKEERGKSLFDF